MSKEKSNTILTRRKEDQQLLRPDNFVFKFKREYFFYLLMAKNHSDHFTQLRSAYINTRLRVICYLLMFLIPLWSLVELFYIPLDDWWAIALLRVVTGCAFGLLASIKTESLSIKIVHMKLFFLVVISLLFYGLSVLLLYFNNIDFSHTGYNILPFVIIIMGIIFPLTILEGGAIVLFVIGVFICFKMHLLSNFETILTFSAEHLHRTPEFFNPVTVNELWMLCVLAIMAGCAELTQLHMMIKLYKQANRDPLTGLSNRRSLLEYLDMEMIKAKNKGKKLSIMLLDLDKFKNINDTYGHAVGDVILKDFSSMMIDIFRKQDLVGRYGGEEFIVILADVDFDEAKDIGSRVLTSIRSREVSLREFETNIDHLSYTSSLGLVEWDGEESLSEMISRVDKCLYNAKSSGRDCIGTDSDEIIR